MADSTLQTIAAMIREVMDDDLDDLEIGMDTSFADDLELESIELVALAEQVQSQWGDQVDFNAWIAGQSLDQVIALHVGALVDYVDSCIS